MAGRPNNFNVIELIDKATEVFWKKGYESTSSKDLMHAMQIGQGSFYNSFKGGKKELYQRSLIRTFNIAKTQFNKGIIKYDNPLEFIKFFFLMTIERSEKDKQKGCYSGNTLVESSFIDQELQELSIKLLQELEEEFEKAFITAQEKGFLSQDKSSKVLAKYFLNLWNGINVTLRMDPDISLMKKMMQISIKILD